MKKSVPLAIVYSLFGDGGYSWYADVIGRHPSAFHRSLGDRNSISSKYVLLTCSLLYQLQRFGKSPQQVMEAALPDVDETIDTSPAYHHMKTLFISDPFELISQRIGKTVQSVERGISSQQSKAYPHFERICVALLMLKDCGVSPEQAIQFDLEASPEEQLNFDFIEAV